MQVFLIRHPPPCVEAGICYGRLDLDCADPAPYAAALHPLIPPGTLIFSSPLRRARRLAEALAQALEADLRLDDRLREIDFGAWEGQRWDDIARSEIDAWTADFWHYAPGGGESLAQMMGRVQTALAAAQTQAAATGHPVLWITHAGVVQCAHWLVTRGERQPNAKDWPSVKLAYGEWLRLPLR